MTAEELVKEMRPKISQDYEVTQCLMVNMGNPFGEQPEFVCISPVKEVYRYHSECKRLPELKEKVTTLFNALKAAGGKWRTISRDGCTIYLRPG